MFNEQAPFTTVSNKAVPPHSSHPAFGHLILLVFEAVLEVVCVSFPGYVVARQGMFNAEMQKFAANLNVMLFTPCLIFTKLGSQLTADKLGELAIIPVIFAIQILVSYICSIAVANLFRFKKRPRNFVVAMGVFGNSNSLPISLVISLSQTIRGLHWSKIPGDNDDEVAARGILYLLIFQQLGQLVRWSWGYHVLLAPPDKFKDENAHGSSRLEQGFEPYMDNTHDEQERLIDDSPTCPGSVVHKGGRHTVKDGSLDVDGSEAQQTNLSAGEDGEQTPITHQTYTSSLSSNASSNRHKRPERDGPPDLLPTPANGNIAPSTPGNHITLFPGIKSTKPASDENRVTGASGWVARCKKAATAYEQSVQNSVRNGTRSLFRSLPHPLQVFMRQVASALGKFCVGVWDFMNPPLWAMLAAIIVASIPSLQRLFFSEGTFVKNSITSAIRQMGGVAVPLILVVLGANLEGKTQPKDPNHSDEDDKEETKLLIASIISRMLLPIVVMAPLLALAAKYVPVSILDDPIFVIVCFLLTGAPSALQLAQICQINGVYLGAMSRLLFQSYVVWLVNLTHSSLGISNKSRILPSTLILVVCSIEVLEWAG
ncbi:MAG: hypothetical protein LQ343_000861 [Gyalolechia ehrenbergii]|nr:MAG: hypothetical protein LQ343_000861 [Gyalolechia ehrenbergii]